MKRLKEMDVQNLNFEGAQLKKAERFAAILLLFLIVTGSLFMIISPFFGWRTEVVISGSMEPVIQAGSVVVVRPIVPDTIRKGDIIMFSSVDMTSLTTHRVVDIKSEHRLQFITRGDANNNSDITPVTPGKIEGIVALSIPYLGLLVQFIKTPLGFTLCFLIPAVLLIGHEMVEVWRGIE